MHKTNPKEKNAIYRLMGIENVEAFYADKFVWPPVLNIVENDPLSRFDITHIKEYWIYNRVTEGAKVLDVGCGSGTLNLLKSKNVYLVGSDLSEKALEMALSAGYDKVIPGDSSDLPFPDKTFDHVVSSDVLGHIENDVKDLYLKEWVRVLKDDGSMLHGIEMGDIDYGNLDKKVKDYILIDGHVGLEPFDSVEKRFNRFFSNVHAENCMGPCLNWYDIDKYSITEDLVGKEFRAYILSFSPEQIKAFNTAMLLVRNLIATQGNLGKGGGFMFIEASKKK